MIRALFKKQLAEAFSRMLMQGKKSKKDRSKGARIGLAALYALLLIYMGVMFFFMARTLCVPLLSVGLGWLGFVLSSLLAIVLGVVGSVFSTYGTLYGAKDNDMLLAMPIPVRVLLLSRLFGVYAVGLIYQLPVMVPTLIVWLIYADLTPLGVIFSLLVPVLLSFFVLILSCLMGFVVALISLKAKHKNLVMTVLALVLLGLYMVLYGKLYGSLTDVLVYADAVAGKIKAILYPFYHMGRAAEGEPLSMLIFAAIVIALLALTYLLLSRSFLRLSITKAGTAKKQYVAKPLKAKGAGKALLRRELKRFTGSSAYMLNCGLGLVMMVVAGVFLLIKGNDLTATLTLMAGDLDTGTPALIGVAVICALGSTSYMTAPSVSLEGKNVWLIRVLPVTSRQVLAAKVQMQLLLTALPTVFLTAAVMIVLQPTVWFRILIPLSAAAYTLWIALFGLCMNLKFHNLNWSNEMTPVKQSAAVFLTLFGGWVSVGLLGLAYYLLCEVVSPALFLGCGLALFTLADVGMLWWIARRGTRIFDTL